MEYIKFNIDEMHQERVFCEYREIKDGKKGPMLTRTFPLDVLGQHEPKVLELVAGEIIGITMRKKALPLSEKLSIWIMMCLLKKRTFLGWRSL